VSTESNRSVHEGAAVANVTDTRTGIGGSGVLERLRTKLAAWPNPARFEGIDIPCREDRSCHP